MAVNQTTHLAMTAESLAVVSFVLVIRYLRKSFIQIKIYNVDFSFLDAFREYLEQEQRWIF
jgi:hypothetical protein